ncbi:hypothetical protein MHN80_02260 [Gordonia McavH-238-E]|uniref:hypothetical protein n=1 Tax=Gordonia sp. McavH-238-E TaxID=2917736 RepID=UPI001EF717BC|nr:hypothetical protein [Gordonia sp. McavH-238-E]MCG7631127.1 hypothetical protein [Gordonia sp. McavH-238-E]
MTASTSGNGPRSHAAQHAIEQRRQSFADYCDRQMRDPTPGTTWHPLYRWPSDTDADYAARVAEHERTQHTITRTTG